MKALEHLWYGTPNLLVRAAATIALGPPALLYGAATQARAALFGVGLLRPTRIEGLQVVSVGNLVAGGSGKTPLVIFLAQWALAAGHRVGVLTRGHKRQQRQPIDFDATSLPEVVSCGDEPRLIAQRVPGVRLFVDADRVAAARRAKAAGCDVVLLDDGFQHRRLARDVDVVIEVPGTSGVLPLGPHREFAWAKRRAHVIFNGPGSGDPRGALVVTGVRGAGTLNGRSVLPLSGIARPDRFHRTLGTLGARLEPPAVFPDHHPFTVQELAVVTARARETNALVVTTEKDAQRLPPGFEAAVVETSLEITENLDTLARVLGWPVACAPLASMKEGPP